MSDFRPSRREDLPRLRQLWKDCFGDTDAFLDRFFSTAYAPERSAVLTEDARLAGGAYWFDCFLADKKLAYVYAVAIDPNRQGMGLGTTLMEAIHCRLRTAGYAGVLLVPGSEGLRRYYERFGYRTCSFRPTEVSLPALTPITAEEYAALRRSLLPSNGVVQEAENVAFLSALADFYRGGDSIAALSREDGSCLELLPPAPAGETVPYAMGLSLTDSPLPETLHFAFGFD